MDGLTSRRSGSGSVRSHARTSTRSRRSCPTRSSSATSSSLRFSRPAAPAELLERWIGLRDGAVGMYAASRREDGAAVGLVGFLPRRLPWGDELEIGWLLLRGQWGRGYATETARALRDAIPPRRLISLIHPENAASIRVAAKLGLELERRIELRGNPVSVYASSPDLVEPDVRDEAERKASGHCVSPFDALGAETR